MDEVEAVPVKTGCVRVGVGVGAWIGDGCPGGIDSCDNDCCGCGVWCWFLVHGACYLVPDAGACILVVCVRPRPLEFLRF